MEARVWIAIGALVAGLAVALGAFGAHGLKERLTADGKLETFETAAQYHMYHGLALVGVGLFLARWPSGPAQGAGWFFLLGVLLFSGSLYGWALSGPRWLVFVTPIGGVCFLVGWTLLMVAGMRANNH